MPPEIKRMNQMKLIFCDWTHGKAMRTTVAVQRVYAAGVEVHGAIVAHIGRNTRPIVADVTENVKSTDIGEAIARSREENGLATRFTFQDGTKVPAFIETSGYVPFGRATSIITGSCETSESAIRRKAESWRTRVVNTLGGRLESRSGDSCATILIAFGVPKDIISIVHFIASI